MLRNETLKFQVSSLSLIDLCYKTSRKCKKLVLFLNFKYNDRFKNFDVRGRGMFIKFFRSLKIVFTSCFFLIFFPVKGVTSANFESKKDIDKIAQEMSLQDKIGQLFFVNISGEELNDEGKAFIKKTHAGNFLLFTWANKLSSFEQVKSLTTSLKNCALETTKVIPLIATDQEGGKVSRLTVGFTAFPCNRDVAKNFQPTYAYEMGRKMGEEMKKAGVNLNFAPVVDVCLDPTSWIAPRCYSDNPDTVISYAKELIKGFHSSNILVTLKHFPGYGDARENPHLGLLPAVDKPLETLFATELKPFYALKDEADFVMTAHILFPTLDKDNVATFSKAILTDLFINQLSFKGIIICDSLSMRAAVVNQESLPEAIEGMGQAAIRAFNAGCDMLILSKLEWADFTTSEKEDLFVFEKVIENFTKAVTDGRVSMKKVDESVKKILVKKLSICE